MLIFASSYSFASAASQLGQDRIAKRMVEEAEKMLGDGVHKPGVDKGNGDVFVNNMIYDASHDG